MTENGRERKDHVEYITAETVAEIYKISVKTVYALCARNELPHVRIGRTIRIPKSVLNGIRQRD